MTDEDGRAFRDLVAATVGPVGLSALFVWWSDADAVFAAAEKAVGAHWDRTAMASGTSLTRVRVLLAADGRYRFEYLEPEEGEPVVAAYDGHVDRRLVDGVGIVRAKRFIDPSIEHLLDVGGILRGQRVVTVARAGFGGRPVFEVLATPRTTRHYDRQQLVVDARWRVVLRRELFLGDRVVVRYEFTDVEIPAPTPPEAFEVDFPGGTPIEDHRADRRARSSVRRLLGAMRGSDRRTSSEGRS